MKGYKKTSIKVICQGSPVLANKYALIVKESKDIVLLSIDMKSKYCEVGSFIFGSDGACNIAIDATERSLFLKKTKNINSITEIEFSEYKGWKCWADNSGIYSINICLIKNE